MSASSRVGQDTVKSQRPICVIDFANYPFIRRLAAYLNEQQSSCAYLYHPGFQSPNQGQRASHPWEYPVEAGGAFAKHNLAKRWFQEKRWGNAAVRVLERLRPSLVIVANAPLEIVRVVQVWCRVQGRPFVYWLQDVHSYAIAEALRSKLPVVGGPVAQHYRQLEGRLLRSSDRILLIADDHYDVLQDLDVPGELARVIPNWSTIEDVPDLAADDRLKEKELVWRAEHGLSGKRILMYSGTLGMKHDPGLFTELAAAVSADPDVAVVVISSGPDADQLRSQVAERGLANLHVLPFVEYSMMATTLQSAEILLAVLEPAASRFSVPSKILTYACAGRPVVVAMPDDNAAARLVRDVGFGEVTPSGDSEAFIKAVKTLLDAPQRAIELGRLGRTYAEANFPMSVIGERFLATLTGLQNE